MKFSVELDRKIKLVNILQQQRDPIYEEELWSNTDKIVYGPVASRRLGESLGINFFPKAKICSFNCRYCDVKLTAPRTFEKKFLSSNILPQTVLKRQIRKGVTNVLNKKIPVDFITICGNGEATDYPYFVEIAEFLWALRNELFPHVPLAILTNSAKIDERKTIDVINMYDEKHFKLDAGDEKTFLLINRPVLKHIRFKNIVEALPAIKPLKIQTAVVDSPQFSNIQSLRGTYIELIRKIHADEIFLHNIDYPVPYRQIRRLQLYEMIELAQYIAEQTNIQVSVLHSKKSLRNKRENKHG